MNPQKNPLNENQMGYPKNKCVHTIFERQAQQTPQQIALESDNKTLTYQELDKKTNQIAHYLKTLGIKKQDIVGVFIERNIDMILSFLAILKLGAVCLPLDPNYPKERLDFMIQDTKTNFIITNNKIEHITTIDLQNIELAQYSTESLVEKCQALDLAFIMYTSGSTGTPKGIGIVHRGIVRLVKNTNYMNITTKHRVAQLSSPCFDAATFEIWTALLNGASLVIVAKKDILIAERLHEIFSKHRVNVTLVTTALFNQLASQQSDMFNQLDYVFFGGEAVNVHWVREVLKNPPKNLVHLYGPTENTVVSTSYNIRSVSQDAKTVPIGKAIAYSKAYVYNENLDLVNQGEIGELCVAGDGLAREYLNRPEITQKAFVQHPETGERLYKTGDLVRVIEDGNIEFVGRKDHQVKIRGFRIEMGEIENQLFTMPGISKAVVLVEESELGHKKLVSYIESKPEIEITKTQIRKYLQEQLPYYMIPANFIIMKQFPINANGKIDRQALIVKASVQEKTSDYTLFSNETQGQVMTIWQKLLSLQEIQLDDNFFEIGGNSLLATQMLFEIKNNFGCDIALDSLYENPTIKNIYSLVEKSSSSNEPYLVKLKSGSSKKALFFIPDLAGDTASYIEIVKNLDSEQTAYSFRPPGLHDEKSPLLSIKKMATFYIDIMTRIQPEGPYMLCGLSMAGALAYEAAQQLSQQGKTVSLLALLDADSGLSIKVLGNSLRMFKSLWHNSMYYLLKPKKFSNGALKQLLLMMKIIWQVDLSVEGFKNCQTEDEQYEHLLKMLKQKRKFSEHVTLEQFKKVSDVVGLNFFATLSYFPKKYNGSVVFFKPEEKSKYFTVIDYKKWNRLIKKLYMHEVPGNHFNFFLKPSAEIIGKTIQSYITKGSL
ncbi:amino acid adenylation domain-containing protein [Candidatus Uabimicrobium sp. HlEnr_7]|uniref:non-ribosomal peptide synthetase n=1 Tax=Candidatus Uabimicrobium helgolandensis TaxID=3095367 RepID=UPI0035564D89